MCATSAINAFLKQCSKGFPITDWTKIQNDFKQDLAGIKNCTAAESLLQIRQLLLNDFLNLGKTYTMYMELIRNITFFAS